MTVYDRFMGVVITQPAALALLRPPANGCAWDVQGACRQWQGANDTRSLMDTMGKQ